MRGLLFALALLAAPAALAQPASGTLAEPMGTAEENATVPHDAPRLVGRYVGADSLTFRLDASRPLAPGDTVWVTVPGEPRTAWQGALRGAGRGALYGLGASAIAVAVVGASELLSGCADWCGLATAVTAFAAVPVTVVAALIGGTAGAISPGRRWRRIPAGPPVERQPVDRR